MIAAAGGHRVRMATAAPRRAPASSSWARISELRVLRLPHLDGVRRDERGDGQPGEDALAPVERGPGREPEHQDRDRRQHGCEGEHPVRLRGTDGEGLQHRPEVEELGGDQRVVVRVETEAGEPRTGVVLEDGRLGRCRAERVLDRRGALALDREGVDDVDARVLVAERVGRAGQEQQQGHGADGQRRRDGDEVDPQPVRRRTNADDRCHDEHERCQPQHDGAVERGGLGEDEPERACHRHGQHREQGQHLAEAGSDLRRGRRRAGLRSVYSLGHRPSAGPTA